MSKITGNIIIDIDVNAIKVPKDGLRRFYNEESIDELGKSLSQNGMLYPIIVKSIGGNKYELIAGSRRLRTAKKLELKKIAATVIPNIDDQRCLEIALTENMQREDLTPFEEAWAILKLTNDYKLGIDEIAERIGKSTSLVRQRIKLLSLPDEIQKLIAEKQLSIAQVNELVALRDLDDQLEFARATIEYGLSETELNTMIQQKKKNKVMSPPKYLKISAKRLELRIISFSTFLSYLLDRKQDLNQDKMVEVRSALLRLIEVASKFADK